MAVASSLSEVAAAAVLSGAAAVPASLGEFELLHAVAAHPNVIARISDPNRGTFGFGLFDMRHSLSQRWGKANYKDEFGSYELAFQSVGSPNASASRRKDRLGPQRIWRE
jgi:hypothetical protein